MASGIYAIANIGCFKLFVGDVSNIKINWPPLMDMLNSGNYPHMALQEEWNRVGEQRSFTFHTQDEIASNREIIGIEQIEH
ncbi:MAG: hypothetical protein KME32_17695 [Mojavia pulchra JT2-VF2]|jgi:hypothetical protein|uniref:Uncharacterized protein n=1 Tax=Mojavia pulchra JT2-VF2 TaxID=287848 RepID=A0A951Q173_9NOST|nr:hypothetical protein [Mojavia pulchra JT2-VF2]